LKPIISSVQGLSFGYSVKKEFEKLSVKKQGKKVHQRGLGDWLFQIVTGHTQWGLTVLDHWLGQPWIHGWPWREQFQGNVGPKRSYKEQQRPTLAGRQSWLRGSFSFMLTLCGLDQIINRSECWHLLHLCYFSPD
jgi:hypothetical protein